MELYAIGDNERALARVHVFLPCSGMLPCSPVARMTRRHLAVPGGALDERGSMLRDLSLLMLAPQNSKRDDRLIPKDLRDSLSAFSHSMRVQGGWRGDRVRQCRHDAPREVKPGAIALRYVRVLSIWAPTGASQPAKGRTVPTVVSWSRDAVLLLTAPGCAIRRWERQRRERTLRETDSRLRYLPQRAGRCGEPARPLSRAWAESCGTARGQ